MILNFPGPSPSSALSGSGVQDPVSKHFLASLAGLDLSGKAKANANGTVSERIAHLQAEQENDFIKQFYISGEEIKAVSSGSLYYTPI